MERRSFAPFYPHPLLRDRHVMTIAGAKLPRPMKLFVELGEDFWLNVNAETRIRCEAHWQPRYDAPVMILVHGLSGSSASPYMIGTAQKAFDAGWTVLRLNIRNCGGTEKETPTLYSAHLTEDLRTVLDWVLRTHSASSICVAGFSLGGSIVLHTLAEYGETPPDQLVAVATCSTPLNLVASTAELHSGVMNRFYMKLFLDGFVRSMRTKSKEYPELYPYDASRGYRDFYTFDSQWTAPAFGFKDANEYYEKASACHILHKIAVPGLLIHAEDDPFVPYNEASMKAIEESPNMRLLMTKYGGHNGFFAATAATTEHWRDADRWWAENRIVEYFTGMVVARSAALD
mgnify:CR=1 FL=1|jgi:uncharacterized protein